MYRILIAEDDAVTRQLIRNMVESLGYIAFVSDNGRHAYDTMMINDSFDLLITDIMMPEMSGENLVLALRGHSQFEDLPIIMMSAEVGFAQIRHLLEVGVSVFIPKPVKRETLQNYLEEYLPEPGRAAQI